ncbi:MAG: ADP-ribosylglycohydrolase family protein [Bacteroidota bacterium]
MRHQLVFLLCPVLCFFACGDPVVEEKTVEKADAIDQFAGFWLGQCIANWTGLITEMDKIGAVGEIQTGAFYTRENWGGSDQPNIWSGDTISKISPVINFVLVPQDSVWGADDDTDIEYIYQELLLRHDTALLSAEQIREGWLRHIRLEEENYLWVSNERALHLMAEGVVPPATSDSVRNEHYAMIDAQLTTEIFGLYAPGAPKVAMELAELPIRVAANYEAAEIARFYVVMYSLAAALPKGDLAGPQVLSMAEEAKKVFTGGYPAAMYDFVLSRYEAGIPWEQCRDEVYRRYQVEQADGYDITRQNLYCNGCFAAGINFAASLISLFYGEGNFRETVKIGTLCGWDSDNPTATWGGLIGYVNGRKALRQTFGDNLSDRFWIHRTRQGFANEGFDDFTAMAEKGVAVRELVRRME